MRNQHRFRALQVSVRGHRGDAGSLGSFQHDTDELGQISPLLINGGTNEQSEIGRNLLVAAPPAVQFVSRLADQRNQLLLDKMVHVFGFAASRN